MTLVFEPANSTAIPRRRSYRAILSGCNRPATRLVLDALTRRSVTFDDRGRPCVMTCNHLGSALVFLYLDLGLLSDPLDARKGPQCC